MPDPFASQPGDMLEQEHRAQLETLVAQRTRALIEEIEARKRIEAALLEKEQMLNDMSAMAHIGACSFDAVSGQGTWTRECARIHDLPEDTAVDIRRALQYYADEHRPIIAEAVRLACDEGVPYDLELEMLTAKGQRKWVRFLGHPVVENGRVVRLRGSIQDITERKQADAALRLSHERLAKVLEVETVGVMFWDLNTGCLTDANDTFLNIMGYTREDLDRCELNWQKLTPPEYTAVSEAEVAKFMVTGRVGPYEKEYLRKDGSRNWFVFAGSSLGGNTCVEFCVDISAHKRYEAELRDSEERLRATFDQAAVGIAHVGVDGRWQMVNKKLCDIVGYPAEELVTKTFQDITHPDDLELDLDKFGQLLRGEIDNYQMEKRYLCKDGRILWALLTVSLVRGQAGEPRYFVSVIEDIDARKQAEAGLRKREAYFRSFFEASSIGAAILNPAGRFVAVNDCYCAMLGLSRDALLAGMGPIDLTHPDDIAEDRERIGKLLRGDDSYDYDKRYLTPSGEVVWAHVTASAIRNPAGEVEAIVGVILDITLRRQAEEAMKNYQARLEAEVAQRTEELTAARNYFRDFVLRAPIPMCVASPDGRIVIRNEAFLQLIGYDESCVPGMVEWWTCAYPDPTYRAWVQENWADAERKANEEHRAIPPIEYRVTCADGSVRHVEISGIALATGFLATFVDVTERRLAEDEARRRRQEAETANQAKSDFLATMSHEIRTPMNAILGTAQILERANLPPQEQQLVSTLRTAGRGLLALINDVLDLSKIEAGHFELEHSPFVLGNVMSNVIDVYQASASAKGLSLTLSPLPPELPALLGDAYRLGQILNNLVGNAIKFTPSGQITVSVRVSSESASQVSLYFSVRDSGIGIPEEWIPGLFKPFVQADAATSQRFGGTGLGLAICRQLVTLMHGQIGVHSQPNEGSEFWFAIPLEKAGQVAGESPSAKALPGQPPTGRRLAGLHLLVVDDSDINLGLAERMLTLEGATCDTAEDGRRAIERLQPAPEAYDAVLMDIQMPVMDGLEATRAIRETLGLKALPVIALTAGALPSQREKATAAGMDDFITKPFELDALVATILRQVPQTRHPTTPPLRLAANEGFPGIPGIDTPRASERMLGDKTLFLKALRAFADEFSNVVEETRQQLEDFDISTATRRIHKLRGIAANLAADQVAAAAGELEQILPAGDFRAIENQLDELEEALQPVLAGIAKEA